jgi:hypothetical protein
MIEQDLKNLALISKIVGRSFYLEDESLAFFNKAIYEPISDKDIYKDILAKEDFRLRFPFPPEFYKDLDEGWKYFQNFFSDFILGTNCNYMNYRENKIVYKNNEVKLKKAIVDFYFKNKILLSHILRITSEQAKVFKKEELENFVLERLERVGAYKLPIKAEMEIVISLNFADWLLCSTAEGWGSCINLESDFHGCYWSGLPGLVGDPNRAMLYITDRNKKEYLGIVTEKMLSRTWLLTGGFDKVVAVRFFPNTIVDTPTISDIIKMPLKQLDATFIAKHPIKPIWFKNGKSSFIYTDYTKIQKISKSFRYAFGDSGFWHIDKATGTIETINIFTVRSGLKDLYFSDRTLERYASKICQKCGNAVEGEALYEFEGIIMCRRCHSIHVIKCPYCDRTYWKTTMINIPEAGELVCPTCVEQHFTRCNDCNSFIRNENITSIKDLGKKVCKNCLDLNYIITKCQTCGTAFANNENIVELDKPRSKKEKHGEYICNYCLKKFWDIGQLQFIFADPIVFAA